MEPWVFRRSLILLADLLEDGIMHSLSVSIGTFGFSSMVFLISVCLSRLLKQLGPAKVLWVDDRDGIDCVGPFISIRVI